MAILNIKNDKELQNRLTVLLVELDKLYSNKSSDEYKMSGDITKSKVYDGIENMTANLSQLKFFPKRDATSIKYMFNALHRPVYKKLVTEYIHKPDDRNSLFTAIFTCGYRVLVGELSRIFAATVATEAGLIYKPDRISRSQAATKFIEAFNNNMEQKMDEYIRKNHKNTIAEIQTEQFLYQEAGNLELIAGISAAGVSIGKFLKDNNIIPWMKSVADISNFIFGARSEINPISFMSYVLTSQYDKKVAAFYSAQKMYVETKKAYEEYMKIPMSERKKKIESKYVKNIKKYNIKMDNLRAQIAHYDDRAMSEAREKIRNIKKQHEENATKTTTEKPPTSDDNTKITKPENIDATPDKDVNTPTNDSNDVDW